MRSRRPLPYPSCQAGASPCLQVGSLVSSADKVKTKESDKYTMYLLHTLA